MEELNQVTIFKGECVAQAYLDIATIFQYCFWRHLSSLLHPFKKKSIWHFSESSSEVCNPCAMTVSICVSREKSDWCFICCHLVKKTVVQYKQLLQKCNNLRDTLHCNSPENKAAWVQEWKAKTEVRLSSLLEIWALDYTVAQDRLYAGLNLE